MNKTSIEWTHRPGTVGMTWNPIRARFRDDEGNVLNGWACSHASPGCLHCYAETINKRFGTGLPFSVPALSRIEFYLDERILQEPLRQKKPATIFVGDMFDLFHESIPDEMIDRVFSVCLHCSVTWYRCRARECDHCPCDDNKLQAMPIQVFQMLTKRADRMQRYMSTENRRERILEAGKLIGWYFENPPMYDSVWPPPNVWLGVSVESQKYADERIPLLLQTPATVRFLSVEPLLEAVDLYSIGRGPRQDCELLDSPYSSLTMYDKRKTPTIDWVICGGESGPGARPFNLGWAESLLDQCKAADVPFFMKQVGSTPIMRFEQWEDRHNPIILPNHRKHADTDIWLRAPRPAEKVWRKHLPDELVTLKFKDRKGGDPAEWPESLRVREFPA